MNTKKRINTASLLAAASLAFSSPAWSLGLGDVKVESFLNQPLQVRIDLISRETDDLASVSARLASAEDYAMIGASLESVPVPIRFSVEDIDGDAYLMATSALPIGEPVVRLIVEVNWSSGRLLREYTVFLDPATFSEAAPVPRIDQRQAAPAAASTSAAEPETMPAAAPAQAATKEAGGRQDAARQPVEGEYGPVGNGETLWGIASNWASGTGLDMNQVMIAIQQENPEAFLRGNINLLKRGAILRMPRIEDVRAISTTAAISAVSEQAQAFRGSSTAGSASSTSTPLLAEETDASRAQENALQAEAAAREEQVLEQEAAQEEQAFQEEAGTEAETVSEELAAVEPELSPQLELVPPSQDSDLDSAYGFEESQEGGADASVAVSALREDLARTEEDLVTQQQENEYLAERIKELEAQLASAEEGNVEDSNMANMEDRLRKERLEEQAAAANQETPWYGRFTSWLIGLLVLVAAFAGWKLYRRASTDDFGSGPGSDDEQLREIKDEAEEVLRVLKEPDTPEKAGRAQDEAADEAADDGDKPEPAAAPGKKEQHSAKTFGGSGADARVLDEESSDPEIQLDLARAYISMGDKEAARVILDEVENNGNEEQRKEARKMLNHLTP